VHFSCGDAFKVLLRRSFTDLNSSVEKTIYIVFWFCRYCVLCSVYYLGSSGRTRCFFQGLTTYNQQWSYNSSLFALIYVTLENISSEMTQTLLPSKIVAGCLYLFWLTFLIIKKSKNDLDVIHKCFLAIAGLFIINPVADPWYFCWVIPFLCFFPYKSWYLLSGLLMLGYLNFHSNISIVDVRYWGISLISWITYVPFFACST